MPCCRGRPGPLGVVDFLAKLAWDQGAPAEAVEKQFTHRRTSIVGRLASVGGVVRSIA